MNKKIRRHIPPDLTPYLYDDAKPNEIDSLAYSGGLVILSAKNIAELGNDKDKGLESEVLNKIIQPDGPRRGVLVCDAQDIKPSMITAIYRDLRKLGVNIKNYIELADTLQSL